MSCAECETINPAGARYCMSCGAALAGACPACGEAVAAAQRFCGACGAALGRAPAAAAAPSPASYTPLHLAERILAGRHALRGEKKQVTVLFCDVVDSTALAGTIGAEAMHVLLSEFFTLTLAEVHRFEGTVNQFLGDGFMAIFGAPLAYEDHAARAALAALAIRQTIEQARETAPKSGWSQIRVRMGLNSGQVVVGAIGDDLRMDYTASGDTTHLAARLQASAAPGEILCGEATVVAARGALVVEVLDHAQVKGVVAPIARHRLIGADPRTARPAQRRGAFVGRAAELAELRAGLDKAALARGGVVEIEGEPGVGKSRLLLEFLADLPADVTVASGQCITYGRQRPNIPVVELARDLFGLSSASGDDAVNVALRRELGEGVEQEDDYLGAFIGESQALARLRAMDPATVRGRTLQALVAQVLRAASRGPLILVVEDLHWADPSSLDFLTAIAEAIQYARCLLIVTFRPGSEPPWSAAARRAHIALRPLAAADGRTLLLELWDTAGLALPQQQERILARAEGNPFFLEQLIRAVAEGDDHLPGDVIDVLGARIDRLAQEDKTHLRIAAVIGREFALDLLEEVAAGQSVQRPRLEQLIAQGFIEPAATPRVFQFVHALTRDVAYQSMLSDERRRWHAAVAERLGGKIGHLEQWCEEIAHHHLASAEPARALPFLETATAKAVRQHNLEAAHGFLLDALRLFEAEPLTPERLVRCVSFFLQAFPVFHFLHRHSEYAELIERYAPAVEALGMPALSGPFLAQRGHRLWTAARYAEAVACLERALALCETANDAASAAHASLMLIWSYWYLGAYERAEAYGVIALAYLEQAPVPLLRVFAHVALLLVATARGQWQLAEDHGAQAREIGIAAKDDGLTCYGGAFLAYALYERGDAAGAAATGQAALAVAPTDYFRGWASIYIAAASCRLGEIDPALAILEQNVRLAKDSAHLGGYTLAALQLLEARLDADDHERVQTEGEALRAFAQQVSCPFVAAGALQVLADLTLRVGRSDEALTLFEQTRHEFASIEAAHRVALAQIGTARARAAIGEPRAARLALIEALATLRRLGSETAAAQAEELLVRLDSGSNGSDSIARV